MLVPVKKGHNGAIRRGLPRDAPVMTTTFRNSRPLSFPKIRSGRTAL